MYTNSDITLFNKHNDTDQTPDYMATVVRNVYVEHRRSRSNENNTTETKIYIPSASMDATGKKYVGPIEYHSASDEERKGCFTFEKGDVVVRGVVDEPSVVKLSELRDKYDDVVVINSISNYLYGSANMHHWELVGG